MFIIDIFGHKAIFRAQSKGLQAGQPDIIVIPQQAGQINIIAFSATNRTNPEGERGISTYPCCPFLISFPHTLSSYPSLTRPNTPSLYYSIEFQRREWQLVYYQLFLDFKAARPYGKSYISLICNKIHSRRGKPVFLSSVPREGCFVAMQEISSPLYYTLFCAKPKHDLEQA